MAVDLCSARSVEAVAKRQDFPQQVDEAGRLGLKEREGNFLIPACGDAGLVKQRRSDLLRVMRSERTLLGRELRSLGNRL